MQYIPQNMFNIQKDYKSLPDYRIYALKPSVDSYTKIITDWASCSPLDITPYCSEISWTPTQVDFTFKDSKGDFNPDGGQYKDYLADGCIIRLKEGDIRVPESGWVWTFTGSIRGQLGWIKNREKRTLESKVTIYSRENTSAFKKRMITTKAYTKGADLGMMFHDVANMMGLTDPEIRINTTFGRYFYFNTNQISQQSPWDSMTVILETLLCVPIFDGEGRLNSYSKNLNRAPDVIFTDDSFIKDYQVTSRSDDAINKVVVTFLDSNLTQIGTTCQKLGTAQVTTGFFTPKEELECWWSDDRKQRARNTFMKVIKSINANLLPIGSESYSQHDEFHGVITVTVGIWVPTLATVMLLEYLAAAFIPDKTAPIQSSGPAVTAPGIVYVTQVSPTPAFGFTIPWGKVLQAQAMLAIMYIMMCLGSCQYEIWGTPYDLVYQEQRSIAVVDGIEYYQENQMDIKNDFLGTMDWADALSINELTFQQSKACPRAVTMRSYLGLEIGDIIQIGDGHKLFVANIKKTIKRGSANLMELECYKILTY